ncbi:MAG: hypothetical protein ACRC5M_04455 [Anaeroplasmataceae bacterium]
MAVTSAKLFFTRIGGKDFPATYNWFDKFGFNSVYNPDTGSYTDYGDPIYSYSLIDVMNNFDEPVTFTTKDIMDGNKTVSDLTIMESKNNSDVKNLVISSSFWKRVLNLLEFVYENQAEWQMPPQGNPSDGVPYTCRGDEILRTSKEGDIYYDTAKIYLKGTLKPSVSSDNAFKDRILSCTFTVTRTLLSQSEKDEDGDTVAENILMSAYFSPNSFIETGTTANFAVYSYEDLDGMTDTEIDDSVLDDYDNNNVATTEFDLAIIRKLTSILSKGKYKRYIRYCPPGGTDGATFFINHGDYKSELGPQLIVNGEIVITPENMGQYGYNKPFYIFTTLTEKQPISEETLSRYVREYVTNELYPGDSNVVERNLRFPNLFTDAVISVYPIFENVSANGNPKFPIDGTTFTNFIQKIALNNNNNQLYEIYYVGRAVSGAGSTLLTKYPLLCIENDINATAHAPISMRFPTYRPIRSSTDENSDMSDNTIIFHDLSVLALSVLTNILTISDVVNDENYKKIVINGKEYDLVSSSTSFTEILAGYDDVTGQRVNRHVRFTFNNVIYKFVEVL